jgi:hypothetical protein
MAGPWSGTRPRLAVTLLSDIRPWAEHGVNLRDVCSRVFFSFRCEHGQAIQLVGLNTVCISFTLSLNQVCNDICISVN